MKDESERAPGDTGPALNPSLHDDDVEYGDKDAIEDVRRVRDWMTGQEFCAVETGILTRALAHMEGITHGD